MLDVNVVARTANNFYPTPPALVDTLLSRLAIREGDTLLEPSAGKGNIAKVLRERFPDNPLTCVELHPVLAEELRRQQFQVVEGSIFDHRTPYDVIVANPPFCEDFQDIDHFMHYWSLLKPGGRMGCILHAYSAFPKWGRGKPALFERFLTAIGAEKILFPRGAFSSAERPTNTQVCMVWATRRY